MCSQRVDYITYVTVISIPELYYAQFSQKMQIEKKEDFCS